MKKAFGLLAVLCAMLFIVEAANAQGRPPNVGRPAQLPAQAPEVPIVYETPFIDTTTGAQVAGSEGKVDQAGAYKVELESGIPNTIFALCMFHTGGSFLLTDVVSDADGEINHPGQLEPGMYGLFGFTIHATAGGCSGDDVLWMSGFSI